ncbi:MAG TPA: hypothetical protein V6D11_09555 [Waterburya sp.]
MSEVTGRQALNLKRLPKGSIPLNLTKRVAILFDLIRHHASNLAIINENLSVVLPNAQSTVGEI